MSGYTLEAGTAPGLANLVPGLAVGPAPFVIVPNLPPRRYFVRVRAASGGPLSAPSNEILVDVP